MQCRLDRFASSSTFSLTFDIDFTGHSGAHGVINMARIGAEVLAAGLHYQRADGALCANSARQRPVVEQPEECDVLGHGVHLAEQQVLAVLLSLADRALRLV